MTLAERKRMILGAIRKLENALCSLKYQEYDGIKSFSERDAEIEVLQKHLHCAHSVEEELEAA